MAFTIGAYGIGALLNLGELIVVFYASSLLFVLVVLGSIARLAGFSILRFIAYIKDELLIVLRHQLLRDGAAAHDPEDGAPGRSRSVVGLVIPVGYSFNLDGTNIYMTLATLFLAQATNTPLTLGQELTLLLVAMLTSKGRSGVTGAGFVTLAATLTIIPDIRSRRSHPRRHRQIHERVPRIDQPHRQRRRDARHQPLEGELDKDRLREAMRHPVELGEALEREPREGAPGGRMPAS